ncbi:lactonase family protein [Paenibacillus puerhi]|uniref:lactonase family protein n=1 Tax=Paenibacillus puerhi TaxID=2692622 RepID=UPI00135A94E8|nr:lactonase family protein [Paenibacillus puerhi]
MSNGNKLTVAIGSYGTAEQEAIHVYKFDTSRGTLERLGGIAGIENPSFLAIGKDRCQLYAVSENGSGEVVSVKADVSGRMLSELNRQPSHGAFPCHLTVDPSGEWLLAVNYEGGSLCVYPIEKDGRIGRPSDQVRHAGRSVNPARQGSPHPHSIIAVPSTSFYLVSDLGTDHIYTYRLDRKTGALELHGRIGVVPGSGPRHLAVHPTKPWIYSIEELSSSVTVYQFEMQTGQMRPIQAISTLPDGYTGENTCAEIAVSSDGAFVYGSNRGHNSIASYKIDEDGRLALLGHTATNGETPRHFALVPGGKWLLAANQDTDSIIVMKIHSWGIPELTGQHYVVEKPSCIQLF